MADVRKSQPSLGRNADVGAKPRRVVHARVLDSKVL